MVTFFGRRKRGVGALRLTLILPLMVLALGALQAIPTPGDELTFTGPMRVIDGDSVEVAGANLRLFGIDAPEIGQSCWDAQNTEHDCGRMVRDEMRDLFGSAQAECTQVDMDTRYNRPVVTCVVGGADLGERIVRNGWAQAYTRFSYNYVGVQREARNNTRGIWAYRMESPEDWRRSSSN